MKIPLIKPYIDDDVKSLVIKVLDSGFLTEGNVTHEFEVSIRDYVGCKHAIAFTSCTTGLESALRCLGIGPGDEIIVPDYTYPATVNIAPLMGATSVIIDVTRDTMLIDYDLIEKAITPRTKAVIPVSIFGNPLDYGRLNEIKRKYNVYIIEDSACSLGAEWMGKKVGSHVDMAVFSFHPRKFITTGEGGMLTTDNSDWAARLDSFKHFGISGSSSREGTIFSSIGTNYKLSNVLGAIGLVQMQKIESLLNRRRELAANYISLLSGRNDIILPVVTKDGVHSYQSFTVFVENRDKVLKNMRDKGIEVQIGTYSLHAHPAFSNNPLIRTEGSLENSRWIFDHCLTLPLYHDLSFEEQEIVISELINQI